MKKGAAAALLVVVLAGGAAAFQPWKRVGGSTVASTVPTAKVATGTFERWVRSVGFLQAANSASITSPISGKIIKLVPEGTRVKKDDPVMWLDTDELQRSRDETSASLGLVLKDVESAREEYRLTEIRNRYELEQGRTRVDLAEQTLLDAKQKYAAEETLVERNVSPRSNLEQAYLAMVQAELGLRNSKIDLLKVEENATSNLRISQNGIDRQLVEAENQKRLLADWERRLDGAIVRASAEGDVSYLSIWKGGSFGKVQEGDSVWESLLVMEVPDTRQMLVVVPVHESEIALIEAGQKASVRVEAFSQYEVAGEVVKKSVVPTQTNQRRRNQSDDSGPREFDVTIKLTESKEGFRHGMTAAAGVLVKRIEGATLVPIEAVVQRDGKSGVVLAANRAFAEVKVLSTNDNYAAIEGAGVAAGAEVFLRDPLSELSDEVGTGKRPGV